VHQRSTIESNPHAAVPSNLRTDREHWRSGRFTTERCVIRCPATRRRLDADRDPRCVCDWQMAGWIAVRSPGADVSGYWPRSGRCPNFGQNPDSRHVYDEQASEGARSRESC
jgi:hypothetical protein